MKIEEQMCRKLRQLGHAYNTERAYIRWYREFIEFSRNDDGSYVHPQLVGKHGIEGFLSYLANERNVPADIGHTLCVTTRAMAAHAGC